MSAATKNRKNPKVDQFISKAKKWREEFEKLRAVVLACPLTEELKWGQPCYTVPEGNVVIMNGFKEFCALLFCRGALVKDPHGIMKKPGENTQAARRIEFTNAREIVKLAPAIKAYVLEAIEIQKAGLDVEYKKTTDYKIPGELQKKFNEDAKFKAAFKALTPGRKRFYLLHFSSAKQSKTREARIEKCRPLIMKEKGLND